MRWLLLILATCFVVVGCRSEPQTAEMPPAAEGAKPDRTAR